MGISDFRRRDFDIDRIFLNRWSPRSMSGDEISRDVLFSLFEAARWAPSSNNNQPWRFLYAQRNTDYWPIFFDLLTEQNKIWAKNAAVLIVVISKKTFDYNEKPARTHSYDTGAAWENLALQGSLKALVVHGMQGFDYDKARTSSQYSRCLSGRGNDCHWKAGEKGGSPGEPPGKRNAFTKKEAFGNRDGRKFHA